MNWFKQAGKKIWTIRRSQSDDVPVGTYIIGICNPSVYTRYDDLAVSAAGSDSARTDLEDRILDSGTAAGQSSGNRHYADALLFSRYYAGEDLGSIPL